MFIKEEIHGDVQLIRFDGKLDVHSTPKMLEMLEQLIENGRCKIVLDLAKVTFISSYGLGALVTTLKGVRNKEGGDLLLVGIKKEIMVSFEITGLASEFKIFDREKEALESFSS